MAAMLLTVVTAVVLTVWRGRILAEAWLLAFIVLAGIATGAMALVWLGRLLGRHWVIPLEDELRPAALTLPLILLIFLPVGLEWARLYRGVGWFDPDWMLARSLFYLLLWTGMAVTALRPKFGQARSVAGLILLAPSLSFAGIDWVLGRDPVWWSTIFGFAFAMSQLPPALAMAFLANELQREPIRIEQDRSLISALVTLTLAAVWLWFVQYLAAFLGNLPEEAAWYLTRLEGGRWLPLALAAAMAGIAIVLLILGRSRKFVIAASLLIVGEHVLHMGWLLRPAGTPELGAADFGVLLLLGGLWFLMLWTGMRRHDRLRQQARQSGRPGSS